MKKIMSIGIVLLISSVYTWPVLADSNGAQPETPASMKQAPEAGPAQTNMSGVPKLVVEFGTALAVIPPSNSQNLKTFGTYLKDNPQSLAEIDGYADHTGHGPANAALAQKRADAVKAYLVNNFAVASDRITAKGYGEVSTKSRNNTEAGKQANRSAIGIIIEPKS